MTLSPATDAGTYFVTHVVLLLIVTAEDMYLADIRTKEAAQNGITKRTRAARNQQGLGFKN